MLPALIYPQVTVAIAVLVLFGDVVALAQFPLFVCAAPLVALVLLSAIHTLVLRCRRKELDDHVGKSNYFSASRGSILLYFCLAPLPLFTCLYAQARAARTPNPASLTARSVIVRGIAAPSEGALGIAVSEVVFPLRCRATGNVLLTGIENLDVSMLGQSKLPRKDSAPHPVEKLDRGRLPELLDGRTVDFEMRLFHAPRVSGDAISFNGFRLSGTKLWVEPQLVPEKTQFSVIAQSTSLIDATRAKMVSLHRVNLGDSLGDLLSSMVLGDRAVRLDSKILNQFRNVGLSHVLAASGFNLTVVVAMTYFLGRLLIRNDRLLQLLCFLTMLMYVGLAGASASVLRAAVMCALLLLVKSTCLRPHLLATLALALLLTIAVDPHSVTDVGLQLSYAATVGLMLVADPLGKLFCSDATGLRRWFADTIAVVVASQSAVLPIQLSYFWQIGLMFVPANLIVAAILAPITVLGFLSSVLAVLIPSGTSAVCSAVQYALGEVAFCIDLVTLLPLKLMLSTVDHLAAFEWAVIHVGLPSAGAMVFYSVTWLVLVLCLNVKRLRTMAFFLYAVALAVLFVRPPLRGDTIACFSTCAMLVEPNHVAHLLDLPSRQVNSAAGALPSHVRRFAAVRGWSVCGGAAVDWASSDNLEVRIYHPETFPNDAKQALYNSASGDDLRANSASTGVLICPVSLLTRRTDAEEICRTILHSSLRSMRGKKSVFVLFVGKPDRCQELATALLEQSEQRNCSVYRAPNISVLTENTEAILVPIQ